MATPQVRDLKHAQVPDVNGSVAPGGFLTLTEQQTVAVFVARLGESQDADPIAILHTLSKSLKQWRFVSMCMRLRVRMVQR